MKRLLFICALMLIAGTGMKGQILKNLMTSPDTAKLRKPVIIGIPVAFYLPETRVGVGLVGMATWRFKNEPLNTPPSQTRVGFIYTQNRQLVAYQDWRMYFNREKWITFGEVGYYRYNYFFHDIGPEKPNEDHEELFDEAFFRVRVHFMRRWFKGFYLGPNIWFDDFDILKLDSSGILFNQQITGIRGGRVSNIGLISNYDTRDNIFFPRKGFFIESQFQWFTRFLGSDYEYTRFTVNAARYLGTNYGHVIGIQALVDFISGDPPFNYMALLGGHRLMRGYYEGKYRDRNMMGAQVEYRAPLLLWKFGLVAFAGTGMVADRVRNFDVKNLLYSYGGGVRFMFSRKEQIQLRVDYGRGKNTSGLYILIQESF